MNRTFFLHGLLSILLFMLLSNPGGAETPSGPGLKMIDEIVHEEMLRLNLPGMSVGIVKNGSVIHSRGYGKADLKGTPVTPETSFLLGSISKSFTALAIMQLSEQKKLGLDDFVTKYLPWFRLKSAEESDRITIRHLISHTSGVSTFTGRCFFTDNRKLEDRMDFFRQVELTHPPGSAFQYSNTNYLILGAIIEEVSGQLYEVYIRENIFIPLDMNHSFANVQEALEKGLLCGFQPVFGKMIPVKTSYHQSNGPAGYLVSNVSDMLNYLQVHIENGQYRGRRILSEDGMFQLHQKSSPNSENHGMGWFKNGLFYSHDGEVEGFHSNMVIVPSHRIGVIVLFNSNDQVIPALIGRNDYSIVSDRIAMSIFKQDKEDMFPSVNIYMVYTVIDILLLSTLIFQLSRVINLKNYAKDLSVHPRISKLRIIYNYTVSILLYAGVEQFANAPYHIILRFVYGIGHLLLLITAVTFFIAVLQTVIFLKVRLLRANRLESSEMFQVL